LDAAFLLDYVHKTDEKYPFPGLFDGEAALVKNIVPLYTDVFVWGNTGSTGAATGTIEVPVIKYPPPYKEDDKYMVTVNYQYTETKAGASDFSKAKVLWGSADSSPQFTVQWNNSTANPDTPVEIDVSNTYGVHPLKTALGAPFTTAGFTQNITLVHYNKSPLAAGEYWNEAAYEETLRLLRNAVRDTIRTNPTKTPIHLYSNEVRFFLAGGTNAYVTAPPEGGTFADSKNHHYPDYVRYTTGEECYLYSDATDIYYAENTAAFETDLKRDGIPFLKYGSYYTYAGKSGSFHLDYDPSEKTYRFHVGGNNTFDSGDDATADIGYYIKFNESQNRYDWMKADNTFYSANASGIDNFPSANLKREGGTQIYFGFSGKRLKEDYTKRTSGIVTSGPYYGDWDVSKTRPSDLRLFFGSSPTYNVVSGEVKKSAGGAAAVFGPIAQKPVDINGDPAKNAIISGLLSGASPDQFTMLDYYLGESGYLQNGASLFYNPANALGSIFTKTGTGAETRVTGLLGRDSGAHAVRVAPLYVAATLTGVIDWNTPFSYWYDNGGETLLTGATNPLSFENKTTGVLLNAVASNTSASFPPVLTGAKAVLGPVTLTVAQSGATIPGETVYPAPITEYETVTLDGGSNESQLDDFLRIGDLSINNFADAVDYIVMNGIAGASIENNIVNKIKDVKDFNQIAAPPAIIAGGKGSPQAAIQDAAKDANNLGGKNLLPVASSQATYAYITENEKNKYPFAPYAPMADLIHLTKQATVPATLHKIDAARILANPSMTENLAEFKRDSLIAGMSANDNLASRYPSTLPPALVARHDFNSFNELGINAQALFGLFKDLEVVDENGDAYVTSGKVLASSLGFNTKLFADKKLFTDNDRQKPLQYISLNAATPKWLIAAAVGWQLFNSPIAQKRRDNSSLVLEDALLAAAEGGAIYHVDYATVTGGAYVFDQRLLYRRDIANNPQPMKPELIITPYGYTAPAGTTIANDEISKAGYGNYYGFPLRYGGTIKCPSGDNVNAVEWTGWDATVNLDLLAFAPHTTNSYVANGASPFKKRVIAVNADDADDADFEFTDFIDVRTGTFAGTGTYVRPVLPAAGGSYANTERGIESSDGKYNGRLADYGNSLRVHGELARIVEVIDILKDGELHDGSDADVARIDADNGIKQLAPYGGVKGDTIGNIVRAIYTDYQVGYEIGAAVSRTVLARNPHEGTVIWARKPSDANDYAPIYWTTGSPVWNTWKNTPPHVTTGSKPTETPASAPQSSGEHAPSFTMLTSGGGFTADRYVETFMESGLSYRTNGQSGNKRYADGGTYTSGDWRDFVVDNVALDWDGSPMNLISGANFGFYNLISYDRESKFQDSYFQKNVRPYANANPYVLLRGNSDATGSNVQGYDDKSAGGNTPGATGFAEPVWYSTGDAMAPEPPSGWSGSGLQFGDNYRSGPVIYCDGAGFNAGTYGSGQVRTLTAPPYQTGTGRWDDRGLNKSTGHDAPGYTAVNEYGSASYSADDKKDPSKNGTLYRNDANPKKISAWRWNWGRWTQIPDGASKGADVSATTIMYRHTLPDSSTAVNAFKYRYPDGSYGNTTKYLFAGGIYGDAKYSYDDDTFSDNAGLYKYSLNGVTYYGNTAPTVWTMYGMQTATRIAAVNGTGTPVGTAGVHTGADDLTVTGLNTFVFDGDRPGKRMFFTPEIAIHGCDDLGTNCATGAEVKVNGVSAVDKFWGDKAYRYVKHTDKGDLVIIGPASSPNSPVLNGASMAYFQDDGSLVTTSDAAKAYVGRFVMRSSRVHRWQPAIGSVYPMYLEINPQAIKNAAIERVVVNLFGAAVYATNDKARANNLIRTNYLLPGDPVEHRAKLQETLDDATPVFSPEPTEKYFRVIVAAGLVNEPKQTVVAQRFLQYVYTPASLTNTSLTRNKKGRFKEEEVF
jgi:hypothetical protein